MQLAENSTSNLSMQYSFQGAVVQCVCAGNSPTRSEPASHMVKQE